MTTSNMHVNLHHNVHNAHLHYQCIITIDINMCHVDC